MSWKLCPSSRGTVSRSSTGVRLLRTSPTASSISFAASTGSVPSPLKMVSPAKLARFAAMFLPGVWYSEGTEMP